MPAPRHPVTLYTYLCLCLLPGLALGQVNPSPNPSGPGGSGAWTNASMNGAVFAARIQAAQQLAALTNTAAPVQGPAVVSASRSKTPPPPADWVAGDGGQFTTENTLFQAQVAPALDGSLTLTVRVPNGATPGTTVRGTVLGLAYCEPGQNGLSAMIATLKPNCQGQTTAPGSLVFADAFDGDGVVADLTYKITERSIAQDIVIRGRLPGPDYWGLSSNAFLTVVTSFESGAPPSLWAPDKQDGDQNLQWGPMAMLRGKAVGLGDDSDPGVNVIKAWVMTPGNAHSHTLLEGVPYPAIRARNEALPVLKPTPPGGGHGGVRPVRDRKALLAEAWGKAESGKQKAETGRQRPSGGNGAQRRAPSASAGWSILLAPGASKAALAEARPARPNLAPAFGVRSRRIGTAFPPRHRPRTINSRPLAGPGPSATRSASESGRGLPHSTTLARGSAPASAGAPLISHAPNGKSQAANRKSQLASGPAQGLVLDYTILTEPIIDIDFAPGNSLDSQKTGFAAVGETSSDVWNDFAYGTTELINLKWCDDSLVGGDNSGASVTLSGVVGTYSLDCLGPPITPIDPMYDGYLYSIGGDITITVGSLPAGTYSFLLYGHGPAQNASTLFTLNGTTLSTGDPDNTWDTATWTEGSQYVEFDGVVVNAGDSVVITASPGPSTYTLLNGMQIVQGGALPVPPAITQQPQNATVTQGGSVSFSVTATGTPAPDYQWYSNDVAIVGATAGIYSLSGVLASYAANYSVGVSNIAGTVRSREAVLGVTVPNGGPGPGYPAPTGMVAWWKGENNTSDSAGYNNGTFYGNPSPGYASGEVNTAFSFDGSDDYVDVGSGLGLTSAMTIEAWVWPASSGSQMTIISKWDTEGGYNQRSYGFVVNPDLTIGMGLDPDGTAYTPVGVNSDPNQPIPLQQWSHVAGVYNGSTIQLYINGVPCGSTPYTGGAFPGQCDVGVGGACGQNNLSGGLALFNGRIDELTVYDHALSQNEIQGIYNAGPYGKITGSSGSPPVVTTDLQSETVTAWNPVTFSMSVTGTAPFSYQWRFNGDAIPGATDSSYTLAHVQPTDAGTYSLYVQNAYGQAPSTGIYLGVNTPDSDGDGIPDWWMLKYFGHATGQSGDNTLASQDYDGDGYNNLTEYQNGTDPNKIAFDVSFSDDHTANSSVTATVMVLKGVPAQMAVLTGSFPSDPSQIQWTTYGSTATVPLAAPDGPRTVWVGLRGLAGDDSATTWESATIVRDTTPPQIVVTSPTATTTSQPVLQLQGYSPEPLSSLTYDITEGDGTVLTGQPGIILDRHYDPTQDALTTSSFQCFDVALAPGANTITLHATDLAGNTSSATYTYTLDYSGDTTAPVLTVYSPVNNQEIPSDTCMVRGHVDDPTATVTAQITAPDGTVSTTAIPVDRDGLLLTNAIPVAAGGNNTLLLTATDAAGNVSTTSIVLVRSAVTITLNSLGPDDAAASSATVSVNIGSTTGYTLWMNGLKAIDQGGGNWAASGVPLPQGGPMLVEVCAIPNTDNNGNGTAGNAQPPTYQDLGNPTSAQALKVDFSSDHEPFIYSKTYNEKWTETATFSNLSQSGDQYSDQTKTMSWAFGPGGTAHWDAHVAGTGEHVWQYEDWPVDPAWPLAKQVTVTSGSDYGGQNPPTVMDAVIPTESCEVTDNTSGHSWSDAYTRTAHTTLWLWTGATSDGWHEKLFCISANAVRVLDKEWRYDSGWPLAESDKAPISPQQIEIGGLGTLGSDGNLWVVLPDNRNVDITPRVAGVSYYTPAADQSSYRLFVQANNYLLAPDRVRPQAHYCVGEKMYLHPQFMPSDPVAAMTYQWTLVGRFWNKVDDPSPSDASPTYLKDISLLDQQDTWAWWTSGGYPSQTLTASVRVNCTFPNGKQVSYPASGKFTMHRPKLVNYTTALNPDNTALLRTLSAYDGDFGGPMYVQVNHRHLVGVSPMSGEFSVDQLVTFPPAFYSIKVDSVPPFSGTAGTTQVVTGYVHRYYSPVDLPYEHLDNMEFAYGYLFPVIPGRTDGMNSMLLLKDGPAFDCSGDTNAMHWDFEDYIRFKPDAGPGPNIYVTLGMVTWHAHGSSWLVPITPGSTDQDYTPLPTNDLMWPNTLDSDAGIAQDVIDMDVFPSYVGTTHNQ